MGVGPSPGTSGSRCSPRQAKASHRKGLSCVVDREGTRRRRRCGCDLPSVLTYGAWRPGASPGSVPGSLRRPLPGGTSRTGCSSSSISAREFYRRAISGGPPCPRLKVQRNESFSMLVRDVQMAVDVDDVPVPSSRVKRSGPPKDSAVNKVRCSTWWGSRRGNTERSTGSSGTFA